MDNYSVIVGGSGQDGLLLSKRLYNASVPYISISSKELHIFNGFRFCFYQRYNSDLSIEFYDSLLEGCSVDIIYYLAAVNKSTSLAEDYKNCRSAIQHVNVEGFINILLLLAKKSQNPYIVYASSCLIYDLSINAQLDESTPYSPSCPYSDSKILAICSARNLFDKRFDILNAIFFNHESRLRPNSFFSSRLIRAALNNSDKTSKISLLNPNNIYDFSLAKVFAKLLFEIQYLRISGDLIFGSNQGLLISEFVKKIAYHTNSNINDRICYKNADPPRLAWSSTKLLRSIFPHDKNLTSSTDERVSSLVADYIYHS